MTRGGLAGARHAAVPVLLALAASVLACRGDPGPRSEGPVRQNPSPMVEHTRVHERISPDSVAAETREIDAGLSSPVEVYLPARQTDDLSLLVHFHGAPYVAVRAARSVDRPLAVAVVNLGSGSSVYGGPFEDPGALDRVVSVVESSVGSEELGEVYLSAFSAGYGAVRSILGQEGAAGRVRGVLLLDGLHAGYVPEGRPLSRGGRIDTTDLEPFLGYARRATTAEEILVVTHSEVFPGTYASTTETTDFLLERLGLERHPVLRWGPVGMQQLSEAGKGGFRVLGFAGNSAPDHVDHLHGMPRFLALLVDA